MGNLGRKKREFLRLKKGNLGYKRGVFRAKNGNLGLKILNFEKKKEFRGEKKPGK